MKFPYKKYAPEVVRPVIPVEVSYQGISVPYEVLIDSGADFCIFDAQISSILRIDLEKGEKRTVAGITGSSEHFFVHRVTLKVGGWPYQVDVGFLPNIARLGYGVVGQKGFFDLFIVKFDFLKEEIELKERMK